MTITIPSHLSDLALVAELKRCARDERNATALLVAHLAEFDVRRLHLGAGCSSLFRYCRDVLGFSEDAAYIRVEAARACRLFPPILERLADGSLTVTTVRLLARHLTAQNHRELIAVASRRGKREVEELIARRFPKPDTPSSVRKVPERHPGPLEPMPIPVAAESRAAAEPVGSSFALEPTALILGVAPPVQRSPVKPLATDRYEFRFTASGATRDKLRLAQDLLRQVVPSGDLAEVVDRALSALIEQLSRKKLSIVRRPRAKARAAAAGARHVPAPVRRAVWIRDKGRCAFTAADGHRCRERALLEYHHVRPYAVGGEATVANIQLRCRAHNGHEADLFFGARPGRRGTDIIGEGREKYAVSWDILPVPERFARNGHA
jgi:hypothetical protein